MALDRVAYKQYRLTGRPCYRILHHATAYYTVPASRQYRPSGFQNTRASSPGVKERPPPEPRRALLYRGYDITYFFVAQGSRQPTG